MCIVEVIAPIESVFIGDEGFRPVYSEGWILFPVSMTKNEFSRINEERRGRLDTRIYDLVASL